MSGDSTSLLQDETFDACILVLSYLFHSPFTDFLYALIASRLHRHNVQRNTDIALVPSYLRMGCTQFLTDLPRTSRGFLSSSSSEPDKKMSCWLPSMQAACASRPGWKRKAENFLNWDPRSVSPLRLLGRSGN